MGMVKRLAHPRIGIVGDWRKYLPPLVAALRPVLEGAG
jgi:hypothetical protein